jgi:PIN domain nuclease of toxin-antitoxin system
MVLDTHVWLWWLHDPGRLSVPARRALEAARPGAPLLVSAISVWEIAVKADAGRLTLPLPMDEWFAAAADDRSVSVEPVMPADFIASFALPGEIHRDPADRIIVAFARRRGATLVTADQKLLDYPHARTLW